MSETQRNNYIDYDSCIEGIKRLQDNNYCIVAIGYYVQPENHWNYWVEYQVGYNRKSFVEIDPKMFLRKIRKRSNVQ